MARVDAGKAVVAVLADDNPRWRPTEFERIARGAHDCDYAEEDVRQVRLLVDWLMELPVELEREYRRELAEYEEGRQMPYTTIFGREAMVEAIMNLLDARFGEEGVALVPAIGELNDAEKYLALIRVIGTAASLDEVRQAYKGMVGARRRPARTKGRRSPKGSEP